MNIEQIVTMASREVRHEFFAMERSLRATGCQLPLRVIPFNNEPSFELPENAYWWRDEQLFEFLDAERHVGHFRKLATVTLDHCAFFDTDIVHLRNPAQWLAPFDSSSFVVADTEFLKAKWTYTPSTRDVYQRQSTLWLLDNFNSGFFAFESTGLESQFLIDMIKASESLRIESKTQTEQEMLNYCIHLSGVEVVNACLPPSRYESTMAVDYPSAYQPLLEKENSAPFLHYAGAGRDLDAPIMDMLLRQMNKEDKADYQASLESKKKAREKLAHWPLAIRVLKRVVAAIDSRFHVTWKGE